MSWPPILAMAAASFLGAVVLLKVQRSGWSLLGAALLFGLAGYAMQGSPGQPSSPGEARQVQAVDGELLVSARREFFDTAQLPSRWVLTADSYLRRGGFQRAAGFYRNAIEENPGDREAWLALGVALVEHAQGRLTPAALEAFERAQELDPRNAGPRYFLGLSWLRAGEAERTRELWREALEASPQDAAWREALALRLMRLEAMMEPSRAAATAGNGQ